MKKLEGKIAQHKKIGNTEIYIMEPPVMTEEEKQRRINQMYEACYDIIRSLQIKK